MDTANYIYLLRSGKAYKIGVSQSIPMRVSSIRTDNPILVDIIAMARVFENFNIETALHRYFKEKKIRGEWFGLSADDVYKVVLLYARLDIRDKPVQDYFMAGHCDDIFTPEYLIPYKSYVEDRKNLRLKFDKKWVEPKF